MTKMKPWLFLVVTSMPGCAFVALACLHRQQAGTDLYTTSAYIVYEIISACVLLLVLCFLPILMVVYLFKRRWRRLVLAGVSLVLSFVFWTIAVLLDAATLLYAT